MKAPNDWTPMTQKIITFGIPCYNSAEYMDHCISSILEGSDYAEDVQIVVVDDGSTKDNTYEKALEWQNRYPNIVKAVHQENGGHGMAVLAALEHAKGLYFKVVDSDDWLDAAALSTMLDILRGLVARNTPVDLFISNYVYEKVHEGTHATISYRHCLPRKRIFGWGDIGRFLPSQNLLMHSLCYRTEVLRGHDLPLPAHTFYVDNIYAYVPLPHCETIYYADIDLYRYFIGREDQSVNEKVMAGRIDQQVRVTRIMMHAYHPYADVKSAKLRSYMVNYFVIMMAICSVFSKISERPDAMDELAKLWSELKAYDHRLWRRCRLGMVGIGTNLPGPVGKKFTLGAYRLAGKIVKFN